MHLDWPALMRFKRTFNDPVPEDREKGFAPADRACRSCGRQNRRQDRAHTGDPCKREGTSEQQSTKHAAGSAYRLEAVLSHEHPRGTIVNSR